MIVQTNFTKNLIEIVSHHQTTSFVPKLGTLFCICTMGNRFDYKYVWKYVTTYERLISLHLSGGISNLISLLFFGTIMCKFHHM